MENLLASLQKERLIAIVRSNTTDIAHRSALAIAQSGIKLIEITWNTPAASNLISQLQGELVDCVIGAGTILNETMAKEAIACGTKFIFTPHVDDQIIHLCQNAQIPIICGALTPTEILTAWNLGATAVKVFPIKCVGGAKYLECLHSVFPQIPLIPTGGVNQANASEMLKAGAIALGVSTALLPTSEQFNCEAVSDRGKELIAIVNRFKEVDTKEVNIMGIASTTWLK
jgi:2-dehydro-3-deoxyphosphogluconate aldolase / (4S)-4-hydroxy-2-oxoglutarate aldolase